MPRVRFAAHDRLTACGALVFFAMLTGLAGCGERQAERGGPAVAAPGFASSEPRGVQLVRARAWLEAGQLALDRPTLVDLPHAEWGGFRGYEPNARGIAFVATEGQVLEIKLARPHGEQVPEQPGAIALQIFLLEPHDTEVRQIPLAELPAGESAMQVRMPRPATYVVRLQPAPLTDALYYLQLELGAALPPPVRGFTVASFFGASRDAGKRHHEGVDIFAPRRTPVLAVADGRATYRENKLGGHSVWVNAPGVSYYYAHLERVAVGGGERVRVGDVIGYVGDSGNAAAVGPHLHFGVYKWGQEPVDPMPLLAERRFASPPDVVFEAPESPLGRPKCSARFPDSMSTLRVCMASESSQPRPSVDCECRGAECPLPCVLGGAQVAAAARVAAAPLELVGAAPLSVELAPTGPMIELASEGFSSDNALGEYGFREYPRSAQACSPASSGLPAICSAFPTRRVMVF